MTADKRSERCARCGQPFKGRASRYHDVLTGKDYHVYHAPHVSVTEEALEFKSAGELLEERSKHPTREKVTPSTKRKSPKRRIGLDY